MVQSTQRVDGCLKLLCSCSNCRRLLNRLPSAANRLCAGQSHNLVATTGGGVTVPPFLCTRNHQGLHHLDLQFLAKLHQHGERVRFPILLIAQKYSLISGWSSHLRCRPLFLFFSSSTFSSSPPLLDLSAPSFLPGARSHFRFVFLHSSVGHLFCNFFILPIISLRGCRMLALPPFLVLVLVLRRIHPFALVRRCAVAQPKLHLVHERRFLSPSLQFSNSTVSLYSAFLPTQKTKVGRCMPKSRQVYMPSLQSTAGSCAFAPFGLPTSPPAKAC